MKKLILVESKHDFGGVKISFGLLGNFLETLRWDNHRLNREQPTHWRYSAQCPRQKLRIPKRRVSQDYIFEKLYPEVGCPMILSINEL